mgnify:CR=1 FL=1
MVCCAFEPSDRARTPHTRRSLFAACAATPARALHATPARLAGVFKHQDTELNSADTPFELTKERVDLEMANAAKRAMAGERADKIIRDLSLYLRQAGPDHARDRAAESWLERDIWAEDRWW